MEAETRRMLWRCRRGLLELDIVLQQFVAGRYADLGNDQRRAFDDLLGLPDNDLWKLVCARSPCSNPQQQQVLALIQAVSGR